MRLLTLEAKELYATIRLFFRVRWRHTKRYYVYEYEEMLARASRFLSPDEYFEIYTKGAKLIEFSFRTKSGGTEDIYFFVHTQLSKLKVSHEIDRNGTIEGDYVAYFPQLYAI